jgi:hypothetical protein
MEVAGHEMVAAGQKVLAARGEKAALGRGGHIGDRRGDAGWNTHRFSRNSNGAE